MSLDAWAALSGIGLFLAFVVYMVVDIRRLDRLIRAQQATREMQRIISRDVQALPLTITVTNDIGDDAAATAKACAAIERLNRLPPPTWRLP